MPSTALQRPPHWSRTGYVLANTRPATPSSGVKFVWLFPSPQGNPRRVTASANSTATGYFAVAWPDCAQFEQDALGTASFIVGQKHLIRKLPLKHGNPAQGSLYLDSLEEISFHNFSTAAHGVCTADDAAHAVGFPKTQMVAYRGTFSQRPYLLKTDAEVTSATVPELKRFVTKFPETESFHRKIPSWGFAFASDAAKSCQVLASLPEYMTRWIYTQYFVPWDFIAGGVNAVPFNYISRTLGTVNDATFDTDMRLYNDNGSTTDGFPAQTLLYQDCKLSQPYYGSDDYPYVDIMHVLVHNPRNWQKQVNPATSPDPYTFAQYEYIKQKDSNNTFYSPARYPYLERNFNRIFWPAGAPA